MSARGASSQIESLVAELDQEERFVLAQYLWLYNMMNANQQQYQDVVQNILKQSLGGSSQIMVFELR
jgi:hypothetical protein